jgi:acyl-CoA:acyl-CoA alkyltransferase
MLFKNVSIHTVAHLEAPIRVTSAEISARLAKTLARLKLPQNYLERMTGIKERRFWDKNQLPSEVATLVAAKVIEKSGLSKNEIDAVISTSVTIDFIEPSIASIVHGNLKMPPECMNFDLKNACLGFLNGIHVAASMIESGQMQHVLVVAGENFSDMVEATIQRLEMETATISDVRLQLATLTMGAGAVAMIISNTKSAPHGHSIRGLITLAATQHNRLCCGWFDRMLTDAPKLLAGGLELSQHACEMAQTKLDWNPSNFDEFAIHQVSKTHNNVLQKLIGVGSEKIMGTFESYGNLASVSLPFTVSKLEEAGRLVKGKRLSMMGIGSGINGMIVDVLW